MTQLPLSGVKEGGERWGRWEESGFLQDADQQVYWPTILTEILDDSREAQDAARVGLLHQVHGAGQDTSVCGVGRGDWQWEDNSGM